MCTAQLMILVQGMALELQVTILPWHSGSTPAGALFVDADSANRHSITCYD